MVAEFGAIGLWAIALFIALSLVSALLWAGANPTGPVGAQLAAALTHLLGPIAYAVVGATTLFGCELWLTRSETDWRELAFKVSRQATGAAVTIVALATSIGLVVPQGGAGGALGTSFADYLHTSLSQGGGLIVTTLMVIVGIALITARAPTELLAMLRRRLLPQRAATDYCASRCEPDLSPDTQSTAASSGLAPALAALVHLGPDAPITQPRCEEERSRGVYKLPPLALLDKPPTGHSGVDQASLEQSARLLEEKIADFGVEGRVVEVQPGPVVSMYKLELGAGIKVSQIVNLADDLSMALRAATIRILAPVPGEAVVGIEVPNRKREKVFLREILEANESAAARSHLTIALGKDIAGKPVAADLAVMPHLLIAGATGTGKSVALHAMIASILFSATPDDVRLILIDPKMLELSVYDAIRHLLVPVVVDPEKAAAALLWATREMEARYRMMRDLGVRNIDGYNRVLAERGEIVQLHPDDRNRESETDAFRHRRLPKIVIIIDELADLLLSEGKTVERDITRLAQKARAAGIHLILATQRPSVDVITGLIKANLPARISLQVTSRVDSRTILDSIGAERLLGAGDMLFLPPGTAHLRRLHGPFVSENELNKVCGYIRAQGTPDYRMEILETAAVDGASDESGERDPLYDEAVRIVTDAGQASISMIQRRLRIGYNRAARMVEEMERDGLVLPADGARPRELRIRAS